MNALQIPDFAGTYAAGRQQYQDRLNQDNENALRIAMQQYGPAAMQGDKNALAQIAQYDPKYAMGLQQDLQGMEIQRRQDARGQAALGLDQQRLELARRQAAESTAEHAARMSAAERAQAAEEVNKIASAATMAWKAGPEEFQRFMTTFGDEMPENLRGLSYDDAPYAIAAATGMVEGFQAPPRELMNVPEGNTVLDKATGQPVFQAPTAEPDPTSAMREYDMAVQQGYKGSFMDYQAANRPRNLSVAAPQPGWRHQYDDAGNVTSTEPIPGSQAAMDADLARQAYESKVSRRDVATDIITGAATQARDLIGTTSTGIVGQVAGNLSQSDAAEIQRQVGVLKSIATIENLQAMRSSSPTGAGLGSVTQQENQMLASATGALDPNAGPERFARQLENYERTLLRIVHGPEAGDRIFAETRSGGQVSPSAPTGGAAAAQPAGSAGGVQWKLVD